MPYVGQKQNGAYMCVFASVASAVNYAANTAVWTQESLLAEWRKQGIADNQLNFGNIMPVALKPVATRVTFKQHVDGPAPISDGDYLRLIDRCIDSGGAVIVSLEHADVTASNVKRRCAWHMISLHSRADDIYDAWDTAGNAMTVTAQQLVTHIPYGSAFLAVHDKHDMLLVQPI